MAQFSDDFTGSAGALMRLRPGWTYTGAATYQDRGVISNNRFKCGGTAGSAQSYAYTVDTGAADHFVQARFLRTTGIGSAMVLRWVDSANFIGLRNSINNLEVYKRIGGVGSTIATFPAALTGTETIRATIRGLVLRVYRNGVQLGGTGGLTIADIALAGATRAGLGCEGTSALECFDDFVAGSIAASLAPARARASASSGAAVLRLMLPAAAGLAVARGRSAAGSDAPRLSVRLPLWGADGRSRLRDIGMRTSPTPVRTGPAAARLPTTSAPAALAIRLGLRPAVAALPVHAPVARVTWRITLPPRRARAAMRDTRPMAARLPLAAPAAADVAVEADSAAIAADATALPVPRDDL